MFAGNTGVEPGRLSWLSVVSPNLHPVPGQPIVTHVDCNQAHRDPGVLLAAGEAMFRATGTVTSVTSHPALLLTASPTPCVAFLRVN